MNRFIDYPFAPNWFDHDGVTMHYVDEGKRDAPIIVMVHGNPTWSFYYRKLITALSATHRVIVPDHIGCGLSDKPQDYSYTLEQHVQNLTRLLNYLNVNDVTLVVHDWGGAIGMGYATRFPEKMKQFVVFNTAAFFVPKIPKRIAICRVPVLGNFLVRGLNGFSLAALVFATSQRDKFPAEVRKAYLAPYNSWANRIAIHNFVKDIPMENGHQTRPTIDDIEEGLAQFKNHPMIIMWGDDDFCFTTRDFLPKWQAHFPHANVHVLPNAGHYVVEDAIETIIPRLKQFLNIA